MILAQILLFIVASTLLVLAIAGQIKILRQFKTKNPLNPAYWETYTFYTLAVSALFYIAAGSWQ